MLWAMWSNNGVRYYGAHASCTCFASVRMPITVGVQIKKMIALLVYGTFV